MRETSASQSAWTALPHTFNEACNYVEFPRKPTGVQLWGDATGPGQICVDDALELDITHPTRGQLPTKKYPFGNVPEGTVHCGDSVVLDNDFDSAGKYVVDIRAIDVYGFAYSNTDFYLHVTLQGPSGGPELWPLFASILIVAGFISGTFVFINRNGNSRGGRRRTLRSDNL